MPLQKNKEIKTICCVAGRSAGHIVPGLIRVRTMLEKEGEHNVLFFSTTHSLDKKIAQDFPFITQHIQLHFEGTPQRFSDYPRFLWQLFTSTIKTLFWLLKMRPEVIISTGGYISIPVCLVGYILRIRTELFELNVLPGRATQFLAPFVSVVYVCFERTKKLFHNRRCVLTSYPIRFKTTDTQLSQKKIATLLGFSESKKTLFILGGSQGSHFINQIIQKLFTGHPLLRSSFQIIHQTGQKDNTALTAFYKDNEINAHVFEYTSFPERLYPAANIIICRAGAGTLFESLFFNKQCIVIPLETASTNHQLDNAYALQEQYPQHISVIRQKELSHTTEPLAKALQSKLVSTSQEDQFVCRQNY